MAGCMSSTTSVEWSKYGPTVKSRIDRLADEKDCSALQAEFDTAHQNDDSQRARTGAGNADLMGYIEKKLQEAGCHK